MKQFPVTIFIQSRAGLITEGNANETFVKRRIFAKGIYEMVHLVYFEMVLKML